jgi:hypothetical protein
MGYQRARVAGRPRPKAVFDQHDRRCQQPHAGAVCGARFNGENLRLLAAYLECNGRPLSFYTDKAALFTTTPKTKRGELAGKDRTELPPTQIGRALNELDIEWIGAHSPQAKGRVERGFGTAQDRLVKGLRVAKAQTLG